MALDRGRLFRKRRRKPTCCMFEVQIRGLCRELTFETGGRSRTCKTQTGHVRSQTPTRGCRNVSEQNQTRGTSGAGMALVAQLFAHLDLIRWPPDEDSAMHKYMSLLSYAFTCAHSSRLHNRLVSSNLQRAAVSAACLSTCGRARTHVSECVSVRVRVLRFRFANVPWSCVATCNQHACEDSGLFS